jgi:hypothetical protein
MFNVIMYVNPSGFTLHRLIAPAICFWAKEREHGVERHTDRKKDTWLALNRSKAKYLGQTMVPKGST